jgi:S-DNA-T family DNA segregation ATPase FtsK/SpoIIIE
MKLLGPTPHPRLNEPVALVLLAAGLFVLLALASYHPLDPSWDTASGLAKPANLTGRVGAILADLFLQVFGLAAYLIPVLILTIAWKWLRSSPIEAPLIKILGGFTLLASVCSLLGLGPDWRPIAGIIPSGGLIGTLLATELTAAMNRAGAILFAFAVLVVSVYVVSRFEVAMLAPLFRPLATAWWALLSRIDAWREAQARKASEKAQERRRAKRAAVEQVTGADTPPWESTKAAAAAAGLIVDPSQRQKLRVPEVPAAEEPEAEEDDDIPIRTLAPYTPAPAVDIRPVAEIVPARPRSDVRKRTEFQLPPTNLLQEGRGQSDFDSRELKEIAARIKSKFEEFNVRGSVVQINPGPVVTTFEYKPEAGVKYSRITTLTEDLCLGLQAESILIERIPGKPTVGVQVPNTNRELIALREILESEEFDKSGSPLTICLGKDISGRIKIAALESMPHLLIAGSTGSGKSVMLNSLIMSVLYKATPHEVRMILVDPKRLEFGPYEGIPHLLTPVITEPKKAIYALKNAVLEMERRLKLLASQGVRNIDQYNRKVRQLQNQPRSLFDEDAAEEEELEPIPYILIIIDELADLMTLERANVEESVTRLAQMARAVGMHLVLATQRPSVDVITGLIKANFPARISFQLRTRVDSRTVLDVMGAEHLLGKGDMLFLPPGSARLTRVHGAFVTETELSEVVDFWKDQAAPEYENSFLIAPPSDDDEPGDAEEFDGSEDPMYQEAVRVVCEMGKASTSTLQRRLRLGYGRAARILDMMQRDGIIGPPDGSRPREVLKRPDWLSEIDAQLR